MDEIYYVDRPAIPATQQVVIQLGAIFEKAVILVSDEIAKDYSAYAVEVKDSNGDVQGTLAYFPHLTYAQLTRAEDLDEKELVEQDDDAADNAADDVPVVFDDEPYVVFDDEPRADQHVLDAIRENRLLNLELELSAAKQHVQYLEDELAYEEGARD